MGAYIYRVTAERVKLSDGREANVARYAYKPSWNDLKWNRKMEFRTGCDTSRALVRDGKTTGLIVIWSAEGPVEAGQPVYQYARATFVDDTFRGKPIPGVVSRGVAPPRKPFGLDAKPLDVVTIVPAKTGDLLGDLDKVPVETLQYSAFDWE